MEERIKSIFLRNGIVLGIILTALSIFSYYFITQITKSAVLFVAGPIFFSLFIPVIIIVFLCLNGRKRLGGYWTFKQATTGIFIMFIVAYLIQLVAKDIIFDKYIEPNGIQKTQAAALNAKASIGKQRGDSQKRIDEDVSEMRKDFKAQQSITIGSTIQGIVISILFVFLFALIFASIFKREAPLYTSQMEDAP